MKKARVLLLCISSAFVNPGLADSGLTFGSGFGALYSGLGVNIGVKREHDLRYLAIGCVGFGRSSDGTESSCGIGAGWIWTNIFPANNKSGLGFYVGPIDSDKDHDTVYGFGMTYVYFFKGIDGSSWNLGVTPTIGNYDRDTKGRLLLQVGYQF